MPANTTESDVLLMKCSVGDASDVGKVVRSNSYCRPSKVDRWKDILPGRYQPCHQSRSEVVSDVVGCASFVRQPG